MMRLLVFLATGTVNRYGRPCEDNLGCPNATAQRFSRELTMSWQLVALVPEDWRRTIGSLACSPVALGTTC
jgi:hypothetical protein